MIRDVHFRHTPVQRSRGHTAIGGAAYRAGQNLRAIGQGPNGSDKWFRYSGRADVVREAFIMTHDGAPAYLLEDGEPSEARQRDMRSRLWNDVEQMENRKNSRLGRELQLGFAYELSHEEQLALVKEFVQREVIERGFIADVAIHNYGKTIPAMGRGSAQNATLREWVEEEYPFLETDEAIERTDAHVRIRRDRQGNATGYQLYNPHAHVRFTPRPAKDGEWDKDKYAGRYFNRAECTTEFRYGWANLQNEYLERAGSDVRVRTLAEDENGFATGAGPKESSRRQVRAIEERADMLGEAEREKHKAAKDTLDADQKFRAMHNETLRQAFRDQHSAATSGDRDDQEARRVTAWWRNMTQRYHQWRGDLKEQASEWGEHFRLQKQRMKLLLGWHMGEPETSGERIEPPGPVENRLSSRDERERDRER